MIQNVSKMSQERSFFALETIMSSVSRLFFYCMTENKKYDRSSGTENTGQSYRKDRITDEDIAGHAQCEVHPHLPGVKLSVLLCPQAGVGGGERRVYD